MFFTVVMWIWRRDGRKFLDYRNFLLVQSVTQKFSRKISNKNPKRLQEM